MVDSPFAGGSHGSTLGSGIMVNGMPFLTSVERLGALDKGACPLFGDDKRATGSEEETELVQDGSESGLVIVENICSNLK